jgi:hypothetical protein
MPNDLGVRTALQLTEVLRWSDGEIETHLHDVLDVRLAALPPETKLSSCPCSPHRRQQPR